MLACKELGWQEISVNILEFSDDETKRLTEAAELDENLVRKNLTVLEEGEWWWRRRILYEQINGKSQHGGDRKSFESKEKNQNSESLSWSEVLAKETGETKDVIDRRERIARQLDGDSKGRAKEIGLDNDLGRLTKLVQIKDAGEESAPQRSLR